ncbi:hypothetical protein MMC34_003640 [Xylographa carneopallida]|nr:hypothetical protein [Xylographa carneopallida]
MPLIATASRTVPETDSSHAEGIPLIIAFSTMFLISAFLGVAGVLFKRRFRGRQKSSMLIGEKSKTPRHQGIVNATRTALSRLRSESVKIPETAHFWSSIPADISSPRPPLSIAIPPACHLLSENASMVPESSPPEYQRHAFGEMLPEYLLFDSRGLARERPQSRHHHYTTRRSREDGPMRSMPIDSFDIDWAAVHLYDREGVVFNRFSYPDVAPPWLSSEEDLEEIWGEQIASAFRNRN